MGALMKYDSGRAAAEKLDMFLKQKAKETKLNYILVVKTKNETHVSSFGNQQQVGGMFKKLKKFIKNNH